MIKLIISRKQNLVKMGYEAGIEAVNLYRFNLKGFDFLTREGKYNN